MRHHRFYLHSSIAAFIACGVATAAAPSASTPAPDPRMAAPAQRVSKLPSVSSTAPDQAVKTFRIQDGFRMDLLASEPLVASPVAIAYDENGRAFVCEMRDYPYTDKAHHKPNQENPTDAPIGRVRLLEDTDGDGRFDKSTVFAEGLSWPTGVTCWKGGVFVAATPDLWYLKDTDGDGKADVRRKVFTGFRKYNVQAVINSLVWGLDNHIHGAGSSNGGQIRPGDHPEAKPIVMSRQDFRFDPVREEFELQAGGARYGGSFDNWGNRFLCNIRNPVQHVVLPLRSLSRNPYLPVRSPINDAAEAGDQLPVYRISAFEPWREVRAKRWVDTSVSHMPRSELVAGGVFTSTAGLTIYRGDAYGEKFRGAAFLGEVANNVVHVQRLTPNGATFTAKPMYEKVEFIASTDIWFRPVFLVNAPDGCLHLADMYRENIEHPWSIPEDIHAAVDLENGRDMGRIWRIAPAGFKAQKPPRLGAAGTVELVAELANPKSWWRETAQRLIFERQDKAAIPALREMAAKHDSAVARLHALWSLNGLSALGDDEVLAALNDRDAHVRINAIRLAEPRLKGSAEMRQVVERLADDGDPQVRFQVALSLGEAPVAEAAPALTKIAERDVADPWTQVAVLSSSGTGSGAVATALLHGADSQFGANFLREAGVVVGAIANPAECTRFIDALASAAPTHPAMSEAGLLGLAKGLSRKGKAPSDFAQSGAARQWLAQIVASAEKDAASTSASLDARLRAVGLLALGEFGTLKELAGRLLQPAQPEAVRVAFIRVLQERRDPAVGDLLMQAWPALGPTAREAAGSALTSRKESAEALLAAVEAQRIKPGELSATVRAALQRSTTESVRERAAKLFAAASRQDVLQRYRPALDRQGDAAKGQAVYAAVCANCHRKGSAGADFGPNLSTVLTWNPEQLLTNIVDPNREVSPNFMLYTAELKDGRAVAGVITAESDTSLAIKRPDGVEETLSRGEVRALHATGSSPMPEGLEAAISVEQMADLIAFLRSGA